MLYLQAITLLFYFTIFRLTKTFKSDVSVHKDVRKMGVLIFSSLWQKFDNHLKDFGNIKEN